jgi:hypothetical protein
MWAADELLIGLFYRKVAFLIVGQTLYIFTSPNSGSARGRLSSSNFIGKLEAGEQIGGRQLIPEEVGPDSGSSETATSDEFSSQRSAVTQLISSFGWKMREVFASWRLNENFLGGCIAATVPNSWLNTLSKNEM